MAHSPEQDEDIESEHTSTGLEAEKQEQTQPNILSRVASRVSTVSWKDPGPPPDGGLKAWTQIALGHCVITSTWGLINSFGVFQTYFIDTLGHSRSDISWIGSVQIFLLFFIGTFSGRALDYGLFRITFGTGVVLQLLGIFTLSVCTKYYQIFLAQGICIGIGDGLMFCPTIALVSTYFSKRKSVAVAIVACGSSTGGLIFPAMVRELLPQVGFGWTVRALAFVQLGLNVVALAFLRTRVPPRKSGSIVDWSAFKEPTYACFVTGMFFSFWALYFAYFYIGSYARDIIGFSYADSINLIFILNGLGFVARILPAWIADTYTGPLNLLIPLSLISGIVMYGWYGAVNTGGIYAIAVVYALFGNGIQGLWPAALSALTTDLKKTGTRMVGRVIAAARLC